MLNREAKLLSAGLSALLAIQPFGAAFAQEKAKPHEAIPREAFQDTHDKVVEEARGRKAGLRPEPVLSHDELVALIQKNIKYVFVLYQENRSFDSYFGTFPGANGLFSQPAAQTPGFVQKIVNTDGSSSTVTPFRIGPKEPNCGLVATCYAADTDDIDHSHARTVAKMDVVSGVAQMDQFAVTEELKRSPTGNPSLQAKQYGELAMAYEDCDTIPLLWAYADRFVLFDNVFESMTGPSTPGNLSIMSAQSGQTQYALHPTLSTVPVLSDPDPFWGSPSDKSANPLPINPGDYSPCGNTTCGYGTPQPSATWASLPLSTLLSTAPTVTATDSTASSDLVDVQDDITFLGKLKAPAVGFGWYEEGFDKEATDTAGPATANGSHASYVTHHNGPQYFGYVANTPALRSQLHGLGDFFSDIKNQALPKSGGVFYVKGGYTNTMGLTPANPNSTVQANFLGDDDHPAYSDAQISEAMVATAVNAIAASPYWPNSAIIITWDDSEGDYDHVPPPVVNNDPSGLTMSFGPRVPLILISPYAQLHAISSTQGSQASVVKFVDAVFGLPPLATLPDELLGRYLGLAQFGLSDYGPQDALTPGVGDLTEAFDASRLLGLSPALSPAYVMIDPNYINRIPQTTGLGCANLGIVTTDLVLGIANPIPSDFNPLPGTLASPTH